MDKKVYSESQIIMYGAFIGLLLLILLPVSHNVFKIEEEKKYENNVRDVIEASKKMIDNNDSLAINYYLNVEDLIKTKYLSKTKLSGCIKATYNGVNNNYTYTYINSKCEDIITLKDKLVSKVTNTGDGLYRLDNYYIYKGVNPDNYIMIDNKLYRILSIDNNGIKIISNKSITMKKFDDILSRNNDNNIYCMDSLNGCNIYMSNGVDVKDDSDIYQYLENVYTNNHNINLVKTSWNLGLVDELDDDIKSLISNNSITSSIGLLNIYEYINTSLDDNISSTWLNNNEDYWTFTGVKKNNYDVWYITSIGTISKKSANEELGVRPIINLNSNLKIMGEGSIEDPYILR